MSQASGALPRVTGLSPAEGSPGTKVTIRGENLGTGQADLVSVSICGMDCTMFSEWKTSHKIVTRTRICSGIGDVIVTTRSGGRGTCTVHFKGIHETVSPTVESAVWVDESHLFHSGFPSGLLLIKGPSSSSSLSKELNLLGSASEHGSLSPKHEADLKELYFRDRSTDVFASNFSPELYLLSKHRDSSFENLRDGLRELDRRVGAQQEGPSTFLKSNVYGIVQCLDVLKELNKLINKDRSTAGAAITESLAQHLKETLDEAHKIFEAILRRKESSDSMRTSLSILHKFRFLFNLPAQIEHNVKIGDYDTVISDYARARSVFHDTEVGIFKRVLNDVEQKLATFKAKLHAGIRKFPAPLEERKKLISYLVQLEPERNPGWEAIELNQAWLLQQMDELKSRHVARAQGTYHPVTAMANVSNLVDAELRSDVASIEDSTVRSSGAGDPPQVDFVLSLCRFFCLNAPDFFKLQQAYLEREMDGVQANGPSEEEERCSSDLTLQLVSRLCLEVRAALLPTPTLIQQSVVHSPIMPTSTTAPVVAAAAATWPPSSLHQQSALGPWLPTCLRAVRNCYSCVLKLDPPHAAARMQGLITDLRERAIIALFSQAAHDIARLHEFETWRCSGSSCLDSNTTEHLYGYDVAYEGASQLPLLFENRVIEALQVIQENVLQSSTGKMFQQSNVKAAIKNNVQLMITSYVDALEKSPEFHKVSSLQSGRCSIERSSRLSLEDKLLVTLANVSVSREQVLPRIQTAFASQQYPDVSEIILNGDHLLMQLEQRVLQRVIGLLQRPLVDAVEDLMQEYSLEWSTSRTPTDVSTYVKEILLELTEVQQRIVRISPLLVERVLPSVAAALIAEIARLCSHVKATSAQGGNLQIYIDIRALEDALASLDRNNSFDVLRPCKDRLGSVDSAHKEVVDDVLRQFKFNQRLQIMCFQ